MGLGCKLQYRIDSRLQSVAVVRVGHEPPARLALDKVTLLVGVFFCCLQKLSSIFKPRDI
jgi:hypothetical protein